MLHNLKELRNNIIENIKVNDIYIFKHPNMVV